MINTDKLIAGGAILVLLALFHVNIAKASHEADPVPDPDYPPAIEELQFAIEGARVSGILYLANGKGPHPTLLLLHGFPGNEKNLDIAQAVRRAGFNVLFFHYRGAWGSEGAYSAVGIPDDVLAALAFLRAPANAQRFRVDTDKLSLLGHSLGGYAALAAGRQDANLVCVGAISPANLAVITLAARSGAPGGEAFFEYADTLFMLNGYSGDKMRSELFASPLEDLDTRSYGPGLKGKSILLVGGEHDQVTPVVTMVNPVAKAYAELPDLRLRHENIPGDHSYSWTRLRLTGLVLDWLASDCR